MELGLQDTAFYDPSGFAWSNGAHACEVEIDRDTGEVRVLAYWGVDDVGTVINPMIVEGQIQGGVAQGLGQALREHCVYDPTNGQLLSGSFMDYAMPRAERHAGRSSRNSTKASPAPTIRWAPKAAAKPARSARRRRSSARYSTRSGRSA